MRAAAVAQHVVLQRGLSCVPTTRASEASVFRSPFSDMTIPETNLWSFISQRWTADPEVAARPAFM